MSDQVIRSQLPNDNYRKGWDETFGKKDAKPSDGVLKMANGSVIRFAGKSQEEFFSHPDTPHIWML